MTPTNYKVHYSVPLHRYVNTRTSAQFICSTTLTTWGPALLWATVVHSRWGGSQVYLAWVKQRDIKGAQTFGIVLCVLKTVD